MPVKPIIKGYYSSDVENLSTWTPTSLEDVYYPLELSIGIAGDDRSDVFQVLVATPEAIRSRLFGKTRCLIGRHILLVTGHDWPSIAKYCASLVETCTEDNWEDAARRLSHFFCWEFEDYTHTGE